MIVINGKIIYIDGMSVQDLMNVQAYFEDTMGTTMDTRRLHK